MFLSQCTFNAFTMYQAWEIKNTWQVHFEYMVKIWYFLISFKMYQDFKMNLPCVFNFPSLVHCENIEGTFEQTDQECAGRIGFFQVGWTYHVPIWYVVVT